MLRFEIRTVDAGSTQWLDGWSDGMIAFATSFDDGNQNELVISFQLDETVSLVGYPANGTPSANPASSADAALTFATTTHPLLVSAARQRSAMYEVEGAKLDILA